MLSHFRCNTGQPKGGTDCSLRQRWWASQHKQPWGWRQYTAEMQLANVNSVDTALHSSIPHANKHSKNIPWLCWSPTLQYGRGKLCCVMSLATLTCTPNPLSHTLRNVQMGNCETNSCQVETCLVITGMRPSHFASWTREGKQ